jgi:hypothetical protein
MSLSSLPSNSLGVAVSECRSSKSYDSSGAGLDDMRLTPLVTELMSLTMRLVSTSMLGRLFGRGLPVSPSRPIRFDGLVNPAGDWPPVGAMGCEGVNAACAWRRFLEDCNEVSTKFLDGTFGFTSSNQERSLCLMDPEMHSVCERFSMTTSVSASCRRFSVL